MLHATYGARSDIDGDSSALQLSELSIEDGDGNEDDDEGNDKFNAAADDDDAPQLAPGTFFRVGSSSRFGRTVRFNGRIIQWQNQILKALKS